jgi:hypothetical protein
MEEFELKAEQLKFVAGEETLHKIQDRYFFMRDYSKLNIEQRTKILQTLFNQTAESVQSEVIKFAEEYRNSIAQHQIAIGPYENKFESFWSNAIGHELRDWKHWLRYGPQSVKGSKEWMGLDVIEDE